MVLLSSELEIKVLSTKVAEPGNVDPDWPLVWLGPAWFD